VLLRDKVESSTDPDARLYKKATADKAVPCYQGHALMENRYGLVVGAEASLAGRDAEREAALRMVDRVVKARARRRPQQAVTLGADTGYQEPQFRGRSARARYRTACVGVRARQPGQERVDG